MAALKVRLVGIRAEILPGSQLAKACNYAMRIWERLEFFLEHGQVEIGINLAENAMRPVALGRKNWLHIGDENAGPKIASIMSVLGTCRRLGMHPRDYLLAVLPKLGRTRTGGRQAPDATGFASGTPSHSRSRQLIAAAHFTRLGHPNGFAGWIRSSHLGSLQSVFLNPRLRNGAEAQEPVIELLQAPAATFHETLAKALVLQSSKPVAHGHGG